MVKKINKESFDFSKIKPNFIYNRIDLFDDSYIILHIKNNKYEYYIEILLKKNHAELGAWLMHISKADFKDISSYIFSHYPQIEYISFYNVISDTEFTETNFFYLDLPFTYTEIEWRLSSKNRQRFRRNKRDTAEKFGEMKFVEYNDNIPNEIVKEFFKLKKGILGFDFHMSFQEYINKYHVSNAYVLSFGENIVSVLFTPKFK